uniref:Uncharacterized protein n=1 Tax=Oryza meridionalis TaxID=40149 RepID=A0A0E0DB15_9ORYZ
MGRAAWYTFDGELEVLDGLLVQLCILTPEIQTDHCNFHGETVKEDVKFPLTSSLQRYHQEMCVTRGEERGAPDTKYRQETPEDLKLLPSKLLQNISSPPTLARGAGIPNGQEMERPGLRPNPQGSTRHGKSPDP